MATTSHYGFTLFEGSDHPTWLTDWNNTITAIDNAIYRIATGGGDLPDLTEVVARLQALEGRVDSDELRLNVVEADIVDILSNLSTLSSDLSALAIRVTTAESDIDTLETAVNTTLPAQIQSINDSITGILSSISSMTSDISANATAINGLDSRVTALEQSSGGGITEIFSATSATNSANFSYPISFNYNGTTHVCNDYDEVKTFLRQFSTITLSLTAITLNDAYVEPKYCLIIPSRLLASDSYRYVSSIIFYIDANGIQCRNGPSSQNNHWSIFATV